MADRTLAFEHMNKVLHGLAGPDATPRDDQIDAVEALLDDRARVLVVQATGWGKSAVYWGATSALRATGRGPTIVVSPLLALMRNQVAAATQAGLRAATINSSNFDEWTDTLAQLKSDEIDVLLISPERLGNPRFLESFRSVQEQVGLVVIDEAHCISDWGHDFRPDYQRITRILLESPNASVLTTTATANTRVSEDIAHQLGPDTIVFRGTLARDSLSLSVVPDLTRIEAFAWVSQALGSLAGSGIIYALTVADAHRLTEFLATQGHDVAAYTGQLDPVERESIEERLKENRIKAVVATSALGMGYDKPDLGFCIHVGSPSTPVAYYQQVGRAGRALDAAKAVLLPSETDERIWEFFATASIPSEEDAQTVLALLEAGPLSTLAIESDTGLRRGRLEALLKILAVYDAVEKSGSEWARTTTPYVHDFAKWDALAETRRAEADIMRRYAAGDGCLMQFLQEVLDDPRSEPCGRCSVCTGEIPYPGRHAEKEDVLAARDFVRGADIVIEPRKRWPKGVSRTGSITACGPGRAVAFADDPGWRDELEEFRRSGETTIPPELLSGAIATLRRWSPAWSVRPTIVVPVPSPNMTATRQLAAQVARIGKLELIDVFDWIGDAVPGDKASTATVAHLERAILLREPVTGDGPILLVAATARTLWTLTIAAALLRESGVDEVLPFVLHRKP